MKRAFAEWENQELLMLSLPHENTDWKPYLSEILAAYAEFARVAAGFEKVLVVAPEFSDFLAFSARLGGANSGGAGASAAGASLGGGADFGGAGGDIAGNVEFFAADTNDTWIRDYGAIDFFDCAAGRAKSYDFSFNAWGGKFEFGLDDAVNARLFGEFLGGELVREDFVLEGGSVDFNGAGAVLTTRECLLNANRNAATQDAVEARLGELFGVERVVWLEGAFIRGDDTDCHVDTLARFIAPGVVAVAACDDASDEHYAPLLGLARQVEAAGFDVVRLPLPRAVEFDGRRLGATYCNFVFVNGGVIVPTYGDARADEFALGTLARALPGRRVVGVDARVFVRQNGSLHCSCQNRFAAKR